MVSRKGILYSPIYRELLKGLSRTPLQPFPKKDPQSSRTLGHPGLPRTWKTFKGMQCAGKFYQIIKEEITSIPHEPFQNIEEEEGAQPNSCFTQIPKPNTMRRNLHTNSPHEYRPQILHTIPANQIQQFVRVGPLLEMQG